MADAAFGPQRELVVVIPRGNGKSALTAALAVFHLLTHPEPAVYVGAASRDQATVVFDYAKRLAQHPAVARHVTVRHRELRTKRGHLRVLASDGALAHGLTPTLAIADELWAWRDADLLEAFTTGLIKRQDARLMVISTAAASLASPLGRLRSRALAQPNVERGGALLDASGPDLRLLEWSVPEEADADDDSEVLAANPAPWIDLAAIRRQRESVPPAGFLQFHACRWGRTDGGAFLPAGAWGACADSYEIEDGESVYVGVDLGGTESETAVVWVTADDRRVGVETFTGDEGVVAAEELVRELLQRFHVAELAFDPFRATAMIARLEAEFGESLVAVKTPQTPQRMAPATSTLYDAVVQRKLRHPDDPKLNEHIANCVTVESHRGPRLAALERGNLNNDAAVALALALDRASAPPPSLAVLGVL